ncbi:hypothetical protein ACG3SL_07105 [Sphingomonas sp. CJ20]
MRSPLLLAVIALAGCTQSPATYPSLLPRPIETQSLAEPVRPVAAATPDVTLDTRLAEVMGSIEKAKQAFDASAQKAESKIAVARGLPAGSSPWLDAQAALSELESLRAPVLTRLSDLEQMVIERGQAGQPPYPALDAAIQSTNAVLAAQDARIRALESGIAAA